MQGDREIGIALHVYDNMGQYFAINHLARDDLLSHITISKLLLKMPEGRLWIVLPIRKSGGVSMERTTVVFYNNTIDEKFTEGLFNDLEILNIGDVYFEVEDSACEIHFKRRGGLIFKKYCATFSIDHYYGILGRGTYKVQEWFFDENRQTISFIVNR